MCIDVRGRIRRRCNCAAPDIPFVPAIVAADGDVPNTTGFMARLLHAPSYYWPRAGRVQLSQPVRGRECTWGLIPFLSVNNAEASGSLTPAP